MVDSVSCPANDHVSDVTTATRATRTPAGKPRPSIATIVVGYDGSDAAKRALASAAVLASDTAQITVVAVAEPYPRSGVTIPANDDPTEVLVRRNQLNDARAFLANLGIRAETLQLRGDPARVLIEASGDADLLIVGSRRLNRLQRLILGSVSSKLVHRAACDVLVVR
jgi:nucleotide-binding universal stress UspA family protein